MEGRDAAVELITMQPRDTMNGIHIKRRQMSEMRLHKPSLCADSPSRWYIFVASKIRSKAYRYGLHSSLWLEE